MSYISEWTQIKKNFEGNTGKKKPSEKFLGVFRKSSGMESACKSLDSAIAAADAAGGEKAVKELESAQDSYIKTLAKSAKDGDLDYNTEIKVMVGELNLLLKNAQNAQKALVELFEKAEAAKSSQFAWKTIIADLVKTPIKTNKDVLAFVSKPEFVVNQATGQKDTTLAGHQQTAKQQLSTYVTSLVTISKFNIKQSDQKKAQKEFMNLFHDAGDALSVNEGIMSTLGSWRQVQNDAVGQDPAKKKAYESSPIRATVDKVNEAFSAENMRMQELEMQFERQVSKTR
jgi:hypothetical protein